jgi:GntR family transcriptional regulator
MASEVRHQMTDRALQPLRTKRVPLAVRAQEYLLGLIESGVYKPGEQLPSENELAAQLGISRPTLREALRDLEQEGFVVRKHGVGTFIALDRSRPLEGGLERLESIVSMAARQGLQVEHEGLEIKEEPADRESAQKLQVNLGTPLISIRRSIVMDGNPVAHMVDKVLPSFLSATEIDGSFNGSVLDLLRQKPDSQVAHAVATITAFNAATPMAGKLGVEPGQAVLLVEETLFGREGRAIGLSRNYFLPGFCCFRVVRR